MSLNIQPRLAVPVWAVSIPMVVATSLTPSHLRAAPVDVGTSYLPTPPESSEYMAYGQGRQTCSAYVQARKQADAGIYLELNYFRQWMAGYMSSYNLFRLGGKRSIAAEGDEEFIESYLESYCRERPEERFASAAAATIKQLQDRH